jgi:hypothetical protein
MGLTKEQKRKMAKRDAYAKKKDAECAGHFIVFFINLILIF